MKPIIIINKFTTVRLETNRRPVVICDIDNTIICSVLDYNYYYQRLIHQYSANDPMMDRAVNQMMNVDASLGLYMQTDRGGFADLMQRIRQAGGQLILLTARSSVHHEKTVQELKRVGIPNPEQLDIHYTNNDIPKAHYMKTFLASRIQGCEQLIFIDDQKMNLEPVQSIFPSCQCYMFQL